LLPKLRLPFIMVPFALILTLVGAAAAGQMGDANEMMEMMKMMEMKKMMDMMNMAKGWGGDYGAVGGMGGNGGNGGGNAIAPTNAPAPATNSPEDIAAYLRWCEENQVRGADQKRQTELLANYERKEAARKEESRRKMAAHEAEERQQAMESEWKMWEKKMQMTANFESLGYQIQEMKHTYYYLVTFEFLKFCKCSDFTSEVERFFHHDGFQTNSYEEFDLNDLNTVDSQDVNAVANALFALNAQDRTKAFFGGLAQSMCGGARNYFDQVIAWDKQYNFLDRLH